MKLCLIDNLYFHDLNVIMPKPPQNLNDFYSLVQLMRDLRGPEGCPWDKEQNHETLAPYAIEETF